MTAPRIITAYEHPPIPVPPFWSAHDDRLGAEDSPIGYGATKAEAVEDLRRKLEDME